MGTLLATLWPWLPSLPFACVVSIAGAAAFVAWLFLDCSFPTVAQMAGQDIRFRFVRNAYLRWDHRWKWYGSRLLVFAVLATVSGVASAAALLQLALGGVSARSWTGCVLVTAVVVVWTALFSQYRRLWWMAFTRRVIRLQPAMKAAVERLLTQWPEKDVFLPGLGNYGFSLRNPDGLLHADRTPVPDLWETVSGISRKQDCWLAFGISSYAVLRDTTLHCCRVEYRMNGWAPPATSVTEMRSPPATTTVHHEYDFPLGGPWYLAFYGRTMEFKDEPDPEILAEVAKRPPTTRLPHRGGRFRAVRDTEVTVQALFRFPVGDPSPMSCDTRPLPKGEVVWLDHEPEPSRSTGCLVIPESLERLEHLLVDSKHRKDRDYAGYHIHVSYIVLDENFERL